jgi:hypothetical protein
MSSTTTKNDVFENSIEESEFDEEISRNVLSAHRPSFVPRQISFSQRRATLGEIILVILPYIILLIDIFLFFLLRGFKITSFDGSILPDSK